LNKILRGFPKTGRSSFDSDGIKIAIFRRGPKMKLVEGWEKSKLRFPIFLIDFLKFDIIKIE